MMITIMTIIRRIFLCLHNTELEYLFSFWEVNSRCSMVYCREANLSYKDQVRDCSRNSGDKWQWTELVQWLQEWKECSGVNLRNIKEMNFLEVCNWLCFGGWGRGSCQSNNYIFNFRIGRLVYKLLHYPEPQHLHKWSGDAYLVSTLAHSKGSMERTQHRGTNM